MYLLRWHEAQSLISPARVIFWAGRYMNGFALFEREPRRRRPKQQVGGIEWCVRLHEEAARETFPPIFYSHKNLSNGPLPFKRKPNLAQVVAQTKGRLFMKIRRQTAGLPKWVAIFLFQLLQQQRNRFQIAAFRKAYRQFNFMFGSHIFPFYKKRRPQKKNNSFAGGVYR